MRQDWCPGCAVPLKSATYAQLLEADEALQACQRSYDALAATWTQWGERRAGLAAHLAAQRAHAAPQPATASPVAPGAPEAATVAEPAPAVTEAPDAASLDQGVSDHVVSEAASPHTAPLAFESPTTAAPSPAGAPEPARASAVSESSQQAVAAPAAAPSRPARPPRRRMAEVFTAPVLLGVSGASLMIAAAIVAVAITWATATPVVRGVLVLVVAGAVGALAVWLRRLHLMITSGSVGVVAMGFAGTSAVAFLSESLTFSGYSAAFAFLVAAAAGIALARLKLPWVGPSAAVALGGFAIALTITVTRHAADEWSLWAWSLAGVATALGLAATYARWTWTSAQHIVVWAGLGWVGVTGAVAAAWLWLGDVSVMGALAALVPIAALAWLSQRWQPVPVVTGAVLVTAVAPGIAYVAGLTLWQQFIALAAALAVVTWLGGRLAATIRRPLLGGLAPGFAVVSVATVGGAAIGLLQRLGVLLDGGDAGSQSGVALDMWMGGAALLVAVAVAGLRSWNLAELTISLAVGRYLVVSGPLAATAAVTVLTVTVSDLVVEAWTPWVWALTGVALALVVAATRKVWAWDLAQRIALWAAVVWMGVVGAVVAVWAWSGDVTVSGAVAGLIPALALIVVVRWIPRASVVTAVALATVVAPSIAYAAGLTPWQQVAVAAAAIALVVGVGALVSDVHQGPIAMGAAPVFVMVTVGTSVYALGVLTMRVTAAVTGSLPSQTGTITPGGTVNMWAGLAALTAGLAVAGVRLWRLRDLSRDLTMVLRAGAIVGAAMIVAGATTIATAVADMAAIEHAHPALASALVVAAVVLMVARVLWVDPMARRVSSLSGVVLAALAGVHGIWGLTVGQGPVLAGLGIALVPVVVLAMWGARRPAQGTVVATVLATGWIAAGATALGASPTLALGAAVLLAALVAWTAPYLPARQYPAVLMGITPALVWGLATGPWSGVGTLQWMYFSGGAFADFGALGWAPATALVTALALAAIRKGPWRRFASAADVVGVLLVLMAAPFALAALASHTTLNKPAASIGVLIAAAVVAAGGLALWRGRTARRLARIGATGWVLVAGITGAWQLVISPGHRAPWDFATTLALTLGAWALLIAASRWWPRVTLAPAALLTTVIPFALAEYAELGFTASHTFTLGGMGLATVALFLVPRRHRVVALLGMVPPMLVAFAVGVGMTFTAATESLGGGRGSFRLTEPWWALVFAVSLVVVALVIRRLETGRIWTVLARVGEALALIVVVIIATAALPSLALPDAPGEPERMLLAPVTAAVMGAGALAWANRWTRRREAALVRWGGVGWVTAVAVALQIWIFQERVGWLVGVAVTVGVVTGLVVVGRRWPLVGLVPATALLTVLPFAVVPVALTAPSAATACVVAVIVAGAMWIARRLAPAQRRAVLWGVVPATVGLLVPLTLVLVSTLGAFNDHLLVQSYGALYLEGGSTTWWQVGIIAASAVAALAWRQTEPMRGWLVLMVTVVASAALSPSWGMALLAATALALLVWGRLLKLHNSAAVIAVALAMVWAVGSDVALAVAGAVAVAITCAIALGWRTAAQAWGAVVAPLAAVVTGVFTARAVGAESMAIPFGLGLAMVAVIALVSTERRTLRLPVAWTAIAITVAVPLFAPSLSVAGVALLLATAAWWRLHTAGLIWAKWLCALAGTAGVAALLAGANIQIIEAYTAVPAITALLIGLQWMRDQPHVRSLPALAPGLGASLIPSFVALVLEPDALWRTIALIGAIIALALIGLRLRWFAPILGTAVTAVVLSVLQIIAGGNLVIRLIAFAVVGALLLGIASYFEKLKELR